MGSQSATAHPSRVITDVDYDKQGKQISYLGVPISTDESAYGTVPLPITVISNGSGPTIHLSGGVHGDEFEGPIALMKLARELEPHQVQGRIIITPCLNLPAVLAGKRCSPIDGLNLNRVFPGDPDGSVTMVIAHYVSSTLLPLCDVQIDLHSGGNTLDFIPFVQMIRSHDKDLERRTLEAIQVFGTPVGLLTTELDPAGNLETICDELGVDDDSERARRWRHRLEDERRVRAHRRHQSVEALCTDRGRDRHPREPGPAADAVDDLH